MRLWTGSLYVYMHAKFKFRVQQVPEGSGEQGKMEKTGRKIICGAPTTLAVKGLMMIMNWKNWNSQSDNYQRVNMFPCSWQSGTLHIEYLHITMYILHIEYLHVTVYILHIEYIHTTLYTLHIEYLRITLYTLHVDYLHSTVYALHIKYLHITL